MTNKDQITVENHDIHVSVNCSVYKMDDYYIGYVPSLKITSKSQVSEIDAMRQLDIILKKYFEIIAQNENTLAVELQRLGWRDLKPPEIISIPYQYLYSKFSKHQLVFSLPIAA